MLRDHGSRAPSNAKLVEFDEIVVGRSLALANGSTVTGTASIDLNLNATGPVSTLSGSVLLTGYSEWSTAPVTVYADGNNTHSDVVNVVVGTDSRWALHTTGEQTETPDEGTNLVVSRFRDAESGSISFGIDRLTGTTAVIGSLHVSSGLIPVVSGSVTLADGAFSLAGTEANPFLASLSGSTTILCTALGTIDAVLAAVSVAAVYDSEDASNNALVFRSSYAEDTRVVAYRILKL